MIALDKKEEEVGNSHMPPKQRITRDMILEKSFAMFKQAGMDAVNARSVAKALNCSTQPIFSYFAGMDDLKSALDQKAKESYDESIACATENGPSLEGVCNAYVRFAGEQPRLFAHLFMQNGRTIDGMPVENDERDAIVAMESQNAGLSDEQAKELCTSVWVYAHGLATARAVGLMDMTDASVSDWISKVHQGEVLRTKQETV